MQQKDKTQSLLRVIRDDRATSSRAFKRISEFLLQSPDDFISKSLQELSKATNVSEPTLIRFCRHYGHNGMPDFRIAVALANVAQYHRSGKMGLDANFNDRFSLNQSHKKSIIKSARSLLKKDQSIIIDSGSTMALFAQSLRAAPALTIFTTGLNVLESLWGSKQHKLILAGGEVQFDASTLSGRMVENSLKNKHFDYVFMGVGSLMPSVGFNTFDEASAHQAAAFIKAADRLVLLTDSSKFQQSALHKICNMDRIFAIITDGGISTEHQEIFETSGVKVIIAD